MFKVSINLDTSCDAISNFFCYDQPVHRFAIASCLQLAADIASPM